MLFKRKGKIREKENERLLILIDEIKGQLVTLQEMVQKSVDPSPYVIYEMELTEAKYMFLLREARYRKAMMNKGK